MPKPLLRRLLAGLFLLLLCVGSAAASHLLGGGLTYRYLDANGPAATPFRYQLTALVYINSECAPGTIPSNLPDGRGNLFVTIYDKRTGNRLRSGQDAAVFTTQQVSCPPSFSISEEQPAGSYRLPRVANPLVTPALPAGCPVTSALPPVRLCRYEAIVTLPAGPEGYYAMYTEQARTADITNLRSSSRQNQTLYVELAPPQLTNASPIFSDTAVVVICRGDTSLVLNNAVDPDGDRLEYAFSTPYNDPQNPGATFTPPPPGVNYADGYSALNPFGTGPGNYTALDPRTGLSRYAAATLGRFVVAVEVKEYRTIAGAEVLIGSTRREVQLISRQCPDNTRPAFTPATLATHAFTVAEGEVLSFALAATDADGHPLTLRVNSALLDGPGGYAATFAGQPGTVQPGNATGTVAIGGTNGTVSGQFAFTPRCGSARATPYDVVVTATDITCGAKSVADVFQITVINPNPTGITGDPRVCARPEPYTYRAAGPAAYAYRWEVAGGTLQDPNTTGNTIRVVWDTPGTGRVTVRAITTGVCTFGAITQAIEILPSPATNLTISGPDSICDNAGNTRFTLPGAPTSTYQFYLNGSELTTSGNTLVTNLGSVGDNLLTARETNANGCAGPLYIKSIFVDKTPVLGLITGPTVICPEALNGREYTALGYPGSKFQWTVTGGTIVSGQGRGRIVVNFAPDAPDRAVQVTEFSRVGCLGPLTTLAVSLQTWSLNLLTTTVDARDNRGVTLAFTALSTMPATNQLTIMRREAGSTGAYLPVGTVANNATSFTDASATADTRAYQYQLLLYNSCNTALRSAEHTTMHLQATATQSPDARLAGRVQLSWNPYVGFNVVTYAIFRRVDDGPEELLQTLSATGAARYSVELATGAQGFNQCFRVRAMAATSDLVSFSNQVCVTFENPLAFYNVITPNSDGKNDVLYIDNVHLYPGHTLTVFNRWGREVYATTNYRNTWGGEGISSGTYYYVFKLADGSSRKGWFEIVK